YTSDDEDDHWRIVREVLEKLAGAGLYLDIEKCNFMQKEVKYLGFIVRAGQGVTADPLKTKSIMDWEPPTSVKGVRSFLGFANFYRCFIKGFSEIAAPLTNLTKKGTLWKWGDDESQAFNKLKQVFASEHVLAQWDPERDTILEADCSGYALGGCLSQKDDNGHLRPVAYHSKRLNSAEANYPIHDKEMHAIVSCLQEWQAELTSATKPFTIITDHKNLSYFTTKRLLNERQVRYNDVLQRFNFRLEWRPGKACERPDALSRRDQDRPRGIEDERTAGRIMQLLTPGSAVSVNSSINSNLGTSQEDPASKAVLFDDDELNELWVRGIKADADWRRARDAVKLGERSFPTDVAHRLSANITECTVAADGVLRGRENRVWIPEYEPLRTAIMQKTHDSHLTGHPGKDTMTIILLRRFFWPKMRDSVRKFIRNCDVCGRTTVWRDAKAGFLKSLPVPERIGTELTIDFVTDLPKSRECTNVMVITDRLSKDISRIPQVSNER
ncbi:hypothetical protein K3495_g15142, partial [Podosphaera aphanis]